MRKRGKREAVGETRSPGAARARFDLTAPRDHPTKRISVYITTQFCGYIDDRKHALSNFIGISLYTTLRHVQRIKKKMNDNANCQYKTQPDNHTIWLVYRQNRKYAL